MPSIHDNYDETISVTNVGLDMLEGYGVRDLALDLRDPRFRRDGMEGLA